MMEEKKRKPRDVETARERDDRLQRESQHRRAENAAEDERIDAMIKRNIDRNGP